MLVVVVVKLSFSQSRMAFAWKFMDTFLEVTVVEVIILDFLQEFNEWFFKFLICFPDVNQWFVYQNYFVLVDLLFCVVLNLILISYFLYLLRVVLALRHVFSLDETHPVYNAALISHIIRVFLNNTFTVSFTYQRIDFDKKRYYIFVFLQLQQRVYLSEISFVVRFIIGYCQISINNAGWIQSQLKETGCCVAV